MIRSLLTPDVNRAPFIAIMLDGGPREYEAWGYFLLCAYSPAITILVAWWLMRRGRKRARTAVALSMLSAIVILISLFDARRSWELAIQMNPNVAMEPFLPAYQFAGWFAALVPFVGIVLFHRFDAPREVCTRPPTPLPTEYRIRLLRIYCVFGGILHAILASALLSIDGKGPELFCLLDAPLMSFTQRAELAIAGCSVLYPSIAYWIGVRIVRGHLTS